VASSGLTEAEIQRMAGENRDYLVALKSEEETEKARQELEKLIDEGEALLPRVTQILAGTPFEKESIGAARAVLAEARVAVEKRSAADIARVSESVTRTVKMFRGLVKSVG
jgi:hypothetical protein